MASLAKTFGTRESAPNFPDAADRPTDHQSSCFMTALLCGSDGCYVVRSVPRRSRIGGPFVRTNGRVVLAAAGGPVELENGTNEQISYVKSVRWDDQSLNLGSLKVRVTDQFTPILVS